MPAAFLVWREIVQILVTLPGQQQARRYGQSKGFRSNMDLTLLLSHFFWLKMNHKTDQTLFSTLENAVSIFRPGCTTDHVHLPVKVQVAALSNVRPRRQNSKDAYQCGEEEPQDRGTEEFVHGFTAVFFHSQDVDSTRLSASPVPSLDHIYFSLGYLEEPLSPICFVNLLYLSLIFVSQFLQYWRTSNCDSSDYGFIGEICRAGGHVLVNRMEKQLLNGEKNHLLSHM